MRLFLLILIGFLFNSTQAQFFNSIGIKSGLAIANQDYRFKSGNQSLDTKDRTGVYVGLQTEMLKKKYFSLTIDLGYIQKGRQDEIEETSVDNPEGTGNYATYDHRYDILSCSPSVKFGLPLGNFAPYAYAGPRVDYLMGVKDDPALYYPSPRSKTTTFGASYGVGLSYDLQQIGFLIEFQHQPDFTPILDLGSSTQGLEGTNEAFILSFGVSYLLH